MKPEKHFTELTKEEQQAQNEYDLREMKLYYGSWDSLRKIIDELEEADYHRAWEKHQTDY